MRAGGSGLEELRHTIEQAAHLLPAQGPIEVFVHHNTLHSFESLTFDDGVKAAARVYGCHAFLTEEDYRKKLLEGRIHVNDIEAALLEDLGDGAECFVGGFGTRYSLRRAMMLYPLRSGTAAGLRWVIAETDALRRFRDDVEPSVRNWMIAETRRWVVCDLQHANHHHDDPATRPLADIVNRFSQRPVESWTATEWERFILSFLWRICYLKTGLIEDTSGTEEVATAVRHRDWLLQATGQDADDRVNEVLIPFCSAMLDQGFSHWVIGFVFNATHVSDPLAVRLTPRSLSAGRLRHVSTGIDRRVADFIGCLSRGSRGVHHAHVVGAAWVGRDGSPIRDKRRMAPLPGAARQYWRISRGPLDTRSVICRDDCPRVAEL